MQRTGLQSRLTILPSLKGACREEDCDPARTRSLVPSATGSNEMLLVESRPKCLSARAEANQSRIATNLAGTKNVSSASSKLSKKKANDESNKRSTNNSSKSTDESGKHQNKKSPGSCSCADRLNGQPRWTRESLAVMAIVFNCCK